MKIQSTSRASRSKKYILISAIILLLIIASVVFGFYSKLGPFSDKHSNDSVNSSQEENKRQSDENSNHSSSANSSSNTTAPSTTPLAPSSSDPGYVNPPISNPPTDTTPYPIENEHYRIDQKSPTNYDVTLYPIANNPDYSDYNAQLKAYKNEVLDYLKKRYGDISKFSFTWSPDSAKNI